MSKQSLNFSPYQPPPDIPPDSPSDGLLKNKKRDKRPWFSRDGSSFGGGGYQAGGTGGEPSSSQSYLSADDTPTSSSSMGGNSILPTSTSNPSNAWESRLPLRVDVLAGLCYLGGPVSALIILILETTNDYVRFHAYQSALLTTPLLLLWLLLNLLGVWTWLRIIYLISSSLLILYTSFRAFRDPQTIGVVGGVGGGLERYYLPWVGEVAEGWVEGE